MSAGCASGDKSYAKGYIEGLNMLASMRLCSNVPAQSIVQTALGGYQSSDELLLPGGRIYEQREFIYHALNQIPGISAVKPKAAFYIFPKIDTASITFITMSSLYWIFSERKGAAGPRRRF